MQTKIVDPKKDIINTLSYKKIFSQPMTFYQIVYFSHTDLSSITEIEDNLRELLERHKIKYKDGYYFLGTHKIKKDEIKNIKSRFGVSVSTFERLESIKYIFEEIPFIKFVGVTGTLASYNFDFEKDDIDLFFICSKNRLWITRLLLVIIFKLLNIYVNDSNPKLKLCPNLYISEEKLAWQEDKRNVYVAHEIAMMQPLINKNNTYLKFLNANSWVKDFLPNLNILNYDFEIKSLNKEPSLLDFFDSLFMYSQIFFMKIRYGSEILKKDIIHFIKKDHSVDILENYEKIRS